MGLLITTAGTATGRAADAAEIRADVVVYGATPAGILAAVTAADAGADVLLLEPTRHIGGMITSGLTWTDIGNQRTLGGLTRTFFDRTFALEGTSDGRYHFQPKTAMAAFIGMLHAARVPVRYETRLAAANAVRRQGGRIAEIRSTTGARVAAQVFIDASYEGDLMAAAGVPFAIGRESREAYGESLAGVRPTQTILEDTTGVELPAVVSAPGPIGSADGRVQASNFRVCFSSDPANQVAFRRPEGYDRREYAVYLAYLRDRQARLMAPPRLSWIMNLAPVAGAKFDVNDGGALSTALPGQNWGYATGNQRQRDAITAAHRSNSEGLLHFLATDRQVPSTIRTELAGYGLCRDEFADNDHWPWLLYVREARRMQGPYVMTQADIAPDAAKSDVIAIGSYRVDSHLVSRWVDRRGRLLAEGSMSLPYVDYPIPYRAITPRRTDVTNLLVPVAISASHVAHASMRMEPHYMLMGEAAGQAAVLAIRGRFGRPATSDAQVDVQAIDVATLQKQLRSRGSVLAIP